MKKSILVLSFFILSGKILFSTDDTAPKYINQKAVGGFVQIGFPYYHLPEGTSYVPVLFIINYHQPVFRTKKIFNIGVDFSPQICFATGRKSGVESGLNVTILMCFEISPSAIFSFQAGSGPHYISYTTERQVKGFIFSDNFQVEFRKRLPSKKIEMNFILGWRHMSNADTDDPNAGIDNIMLGFGISRLW